jgi:DNA-directed RNA polymerase specialized sigma24 family protein
MTQPLELKPEGEDGDYYIREEGSGAFTRIQSGWTTPTDNDPDVIRALFTLSPEDREIIVLHVIAGFKSREIAQITGLKASTVRSKEARALNKIREVLS